jgi:hypothetical protein
MYPFALIRFAIGIDYAYLQSYTLEFVCMCLLQWQLVCGSQLQQMTHRCCLPQVPSLHSSGGNST